MPAAAKLTLNQKLFEVQKAIISIDAVGESNKGKYQSITTIIHTIRPLLNDQRIRLKTDFTIESHERLLFKFKTSEKIETQIFTNVTFTWINVDDPLDIEIITWQSIGMGDTAQSIGSSLTYALRYLLITQFLIPTTPPPEHLLGEDVIDDPEMKNKVFNADNIDELLLLHESLTAEDQEKFKGLFKLRKVAIQKLTKPTQNVKRNPK